MVCLGLGLHSLVSNKHVHALDPTQAFFSFLRLTDLFITFGAAPGLHCRPRPFSGCGEHGGLTAVLLAAAASRVEQRLGRGL